MPKALSSCLCRAGVLTPYSNHGAPSESVHWPVAAEFNFESALGLEDELLLSQSDIMGGRSPVRVSDQGSCTEFSKAVANRIARETFLGDVATLEERDDVQSIAYFEAVDALFGKFIAVFQTASDSIKSRRKGLWRKHDNNDDGANTIRRDLSAAKSIVYATLSSSGNGRRTTMLRRVIAKHPLIAANLQLAEQRITSWVPIMA